TKSLALEHVQDGLNINAIAPGRIETPRVRGHYSDEAWAAEVAKISMGRPGIPEEIASAALFLVLDENKYITGQTIHVNGAWLNWGKSRQLGIVSFFNRQLRSSIRLSAFEQQNRRKIMYGWRA